MGKTVTLRFAKQNKETWEFIKVGKKKVETRAGTVKYLKLQKGDTLVLSCGTSKLKKKIKKVTHFKTVESLIKKYKPSVINPGATSLKEMKAMYASYPGYTEKIKAFGILAFELQ